MPDALPIDSPAPHRWLLRVALLIFVAGAGYFAVHWAHDHDGVAIRDFVAPYTGARCLWAGCNPYDTGQIVQEFARAGGGLHDHPRWSEAAPVYPPSTLVVLLPFSVLHYHVARAVWYALCLALMFAGLLAIADLAPPRHQAWCLLLGVALLASEPAELLWHVGQPSAVAIGVAALALWCFVRKRWVTAGWIALGLAIALKPQTAGVLFLCLALRPEFRRPAMKSALLATAMLLGGCAWLSLSPDARAWPHDMQSAINLTLLPGAVNDPGLANPGSIQFTNAQAVLALLNLSPHSYNLLAYALGAALLAAWAMLTARAGASPRALFASAAAIACIGLLPAYHREYDVALLMFSFPTLLDLVFQRRATGFAALACTAILLATPHWHHLWLQAVLNMRVMPSVTSPQMRALLFMRQLPVLLLALGLIYLGVLAVMGRQDSGPLSRG